MQRFEELKHYLHSNFVELDHAIRALLLGLTAKTHVFLLGPPGTAKSHLAEVLCDALELKPFRFLFTDEAKHKDIFGIQSIQALKEDKDVLITEGKLPQAEMAYLDEIWKANASVVNMLLGSKRRKVHQRRTDGRCPLFLPLPAPTKFRKTRLGEQSTTGF